MCSNTDREASSSPPRLTPDSLFPSRHCICAVSAGHMHSGVSGLHRWSPTPTPLLNSPPQYCGGKCLMQVPFGCPLLVWKSSGSCTLICSFHNSVWVCTCPMSLRSNWWTSQRKFGLTVHFPLCLTPVASSVCLLSITRGTCFPPALPRFPVKNLYIFYILSMVN